jgi:hypothetical protein
VSSSASCATTNAVSDSNPDARQARWIFVVGVVGAAIVTASACSLTNLDPYTSGGGVVDTGGNNDATTDAKIDTRPDSTKIDEGVDTEGETSEDTGVADTAKVDSTVVDTSDAADGSVADTIEAGDTADTRDSTVAETTTDTAPVETNLGDTGDASCPITAFGISEIMVRPIAGSADQHEWLELTNYGTCTIDVGGVTVRVSSSGTEKAVFTFPDATMVTAGTGVVIAGTESVFRGDILPTYTLGQVFNFAKTGDILVNGGNITITIAAAGSSTPYETAFVPSRGSSWPGLGRSYAYPVPSATCPVSGRFATGGTLSATWKDTPATTSDQYGGASGDAGAPLYGSPTQPNTDIACP